MKTIKLTNFKVFDFASVFYIISFLLFMFLCIIVILSSNTHSYISIIMAILCIIGVYNVSKFIFYRKRLLCDTYAISAQIDDTKIIINYNVKNKISCKTIELSDIVEFKVIIHSHLNMPGIAMCNRMTTMFPLAKSSIKITTNNETIDIPVFYHSYGYSGSEYFMFPLLDESRKINNFKWEVLGNGADIMNETYKSYLEKQNN